MEAFSFMSALARLFKKFRGKQRIIRKLFLSTLLLLLLLGAGTMGLLQTSWAGRIILAYASRRLSDDLGCTISMKQLNGFLPFHCRIHSITATDPSGIFLRIHSVDTRIAILPLIQGRIDISTVRMGSVTLYRVPDVDGTAAENPKPSLPSLPLTLPLPRLPEVSIRDIQIPQVTLRQPVTGQKQITLGIQGRLIHSAEVDTDLQIRIFTPGRDMLGMDASVRYARSKDRLHVNANAFVHTDILPLPDTVSPKADTLRCSLSGDGPSKKWSGSLTLKSGTQKVLTSRISTTRSNGPRLQIQGELRPHALADSPVQRLFSNTDSAIPFSATVKFEPDQHRALLEKVDISLRDLSPAASAKLKLDNRSLNLSLDIPDLSALSGLGIPGTKGTLRADCSVNNNKISGQIIGHINDISPLISRLGPGVSGRADLELSASGTLDTPTAELKISIKNMVPSFASKEDFPRTGMELTSALSADRVTAEITIRQDKYASFTGQMDLPLKRVAGLPSGIKDGSVSGSLNGTLQMPVLSLLFPGIGFFTAGTLDCNLNIAGTADRPDLDGTLEVKDSAFEHYKYGVALRDIHALIQPSASGLTIESLSAKDGGTGSISGCGEFTIRRNDHHPFTLSLTLKEIMLLHTDTIRTRADGTIRFHGNMKESRLESTITIDPLEFYIPEIPPSGMEGLRVVSNTTTEEPPKAPPPRTADSGLSAVLQRIRLDVDISIPGRMVVRGRGVNSEWKGKIAIQGTAADPVPSGRIELVRGRVDFLTKRFRLEKGRISLTGTFPPDPTIELQGNHSEDDLTVIVTVSGQATDPDIRLTSEPTMPRDKILSRLLFGRNLEQITPFQAVKLAWAVRTLTTGGKRGFVAKTRDFLAIDDLDIKESETGENGAVIGIGKYLTENIYFRVEQGFREELGVVIVEIEIIPSLSLETRAGSTTRGATFKWKYSY